jgi:hypothetical protein
MRRAWLRHRLKWVDLGKKSENGFEIVKATNPGYTTVSVAVPIRETLDAIRDAMIVSWENPEAAPNRSGLSTGGSER